MVPSVNDYTTFCRKTDGDVPPKLVGASTTVLGSKVYVFGGRSGTDRRMVSDLYALDLETFVWEQIHYYPDDDVPSPRCFHSADTWNNHLVIFGGMGTQSGSSTSTPGDMCIFNDIRLYDLSTRHWVPANPPSTEQHSFLPPARYGHVSSVTGSMLLIIGGQDLLETWLDDICTFDLITRTWMDRRDYHRHCGTYRSVAVSPPMTVVYPSKSSTEKRIGGLKHQPYSAVSNGDPPNSVYLYSNYNFTDVKRELKIILPLHETNFIIEDHSTDMEGPNLPPGLRFPTGAVLGNHLIIAGTFLAHHFQTFAIWVMDLTTMAWSRIDTGKAMERGSWLRGCLWVEGNKFVVFGNRNESLVVDYNRRLVRWDDVAIVELEAFGIYQPPPLKLEIPMQELGLSMLEKGMLADFDMICDNGQRISCSRRMLEERWPWFQEQRRQFLKKAENKLTALPSSTLHIPLPEVAGEEELVRVDPRLTPRGFHLSAPYDLTLALLQYFYSLALITPLQHTPSVLIQLLILSSNYGLNHLKSLVKHAMHQSLSNSTSVGIFESAMLCHCLNLQLRALKAVMAYAKRSSRKAGKEDDRHTAVSRSSPVVKSIDYGTPRTRNGEKWPVIAVLAAQAYSNNPPA
ncbi:hypothetical protein D9613_006030 [Agrocybe pediades]|uniref:Galactose oxidase n=1 Tax=Agrocybe pediades TaxID=84607 RepID=A0A8H4QTL0_9AGAR|nr:hypothetical protein D9613_006030 [Agrocybe pediades]